jgi:hypothetical protein
MKKVITVLMMTAFFSVGAGTVIAAPKSEPAKQEKPSFWSRVKTDTHKLTSKFHKKSENDKKDLKK